MSATPAQHEWVSHGEQTQVSPVPLFQTDLQDAYRYLSTRKSKIKNAEMDILYNVLLSAIADLELLAEEWKGVARNPEQGETELTINAMAWILDDDVNVTSFLYIADVFDVPVDRFRRACVAHYQERYGLEATIPALMTRRKGFINGHEFIRPAHCSLCLHKYHYRNSVAGWARRA
jgi:hypothetical protein